MKKIVKFGIKQCSECVYQTQNEILLEKLATEKDNTEIAKRFYKLAINDFNNNFKRIATLHSESVYVISKADYEAIINKQLGVADNDRT